jgi:hypothetical protein
VLGVFSSNRYAHDHPVHPGYEFCHLLFRANVGGGKETLSDETIGIQWFPKGRLPALADGHKARIMFGLQKTENGNVNPYFE